MRASAINASSLSSGNTAFWLNIQNRYEIDSMKAETKECIKRIQPIKDCVFA